MLQDRTLSKNVNCELAAGTSLHNKGNWFESVVTHCVGESVVYGNETFLPRIFTVEDQLHDTKRNLRFFTFSLYVNGNLPCSYPHSGTVVVQHCSELLISTSGSYAHYLARCTHGAVYRLGADSAFLH